MDSHVTNLDALRLLDDESGKLFIGGLSWDTTHANLLKYFSRYGKIVDCVVMKNSTTGKSRGFGFVKFSDPKVLDQILLESPHWIDGRQVDAKVCNPRALNQGGKSAENSKRKIFIGGLPPTCDEAQLKEVFRKYGAVEDASIMYDQERNRSRGFGFLTFESEDGVDRVVEDHFIYINGKQVECKRAEPRQVKSVADTGKRAGRVLTQDELCAQAQALFLGYGSGASGSIPVLTNGHASQSSSPHSNAAACTVGASMHQAGSPAMVAPQPYFAPAPVPFLYPGPFGTFYCMPEPMHGVVRQGLLNVLDGPLSAGPPNMPHQVFPIAFQNMDIASSRAAMAGAAAAGGHESGTPSSGAAAISYQPAVTYTLGPALTPMPGGGYMHIMQANGEPGLIQQVSNIGRMPTNHGSSNFGFHPYRRQ